MNLFHAPFRRFPRAGGLRAARRGAVAAFALAALPAAAAGAGTAPAAPGPANKPVAIETARAALGKWFEVQQAIAREKREWQQDKEVLEARIEVLQRELADMDERLGKARDKLGEAERSKTGVVATNEELKAASAELAVAAGELEGRVRALHARMPEPFLPRVQQLYDRMPSDPTNARVSVAERFQNVLGILNEMNKFNTEISLAYEVRNLADGKPAEVKAFYVGLAQAWFVSAQGEAGIGMPAERGWAWQPAAGEVLRVRQAIDILQNKGTPEFIPLSMTLK